MKTLTKALALLTCAWIIGNALAGTSGNLTWAPNYPKEGSMAGYVAVKGTVVPKTGWNFKDPNNPTVSATTFLNGQSVKSYDPIPVVKSTWEGELGGLTSGTTYQVQIEAKLYDKDGVEDTLRLTGTAKAR